MNPTILICDDSYAVHESLRSFLEEADFDCVSTYDGEEALQVLRSRRIDLVILDIMLPKLFGTEVCREIRRTSDVPIILFSALGSENDRIQGLRLGADDYVTKPFSPREVVARVQAILRRANPKRPNKQLRFAELLVDLDAYLAWVNGTPVSLTPNEIKMLGYFIENAGVVLSRERLLNAVWGYDYVGDTRAVDAQIKRLRKKLPAEGVHFKIQSVYGIGFRLEELK